MSIIISGRSLSLNPILCTHILSAHTTRQLLFLFIFFKHHTDPEDTRKMRNQGQCLPYRLFLRCQLCSSLALVRFLRKTQFAFLKFSKHPGNKESQWMFQTICRRCEELNPAVNDLPTCERIGNYISIDQVAGSLSAECALVALHADLTYFFWTPESPRVLRNIQYLFLLLWLFVQRLLHFVFEIHRLRRYATPSPIDAHILTSLLVYNLAEQILIIHWVNVAASIRFFHFWC